MTLERKESRDCLIDLVLKVCSAKNLEFEAQKTQSLHRRKLPVCSAKNSEFVPQKTMSLKRKKLGVSCAEKLSETKKFSLNRRKCPYTRRSRPRAYSRSD